MHFNFIPAVFILCNTTFSSLVISHKALCSTAGLLKKNKVSLTQYGTQFCVCELSPHQWWPKTHLESQRRGQVNASTPSWSANERGHASLQSSFLSPSLSPFRVESILDVKGLTFLAYSARSLRPLPHPPISRPSTRPSLNEIKIILRLFSSYFNPYSFWLDYLFYSF